MAVKTASALKTQAQGTDFQDQINDLVDSAMASASATAEGRVELATNAEARAGTDTARAVTPANAANMFAGCKLLTFVGRNGAGAITLTGAAVGDKVIAVAGLTSGSLGDATASFESTITVVNQIQQASASDLSTKTYIALLRAVA